MRTLEDARPRVKQGVVTFWTGVLPGVACWGPSGPDRSTSIAHKTCDAGYATGCAKLGLMCDESKGVRQDDAKAVSLYKKACDAGYAAGCFNLGVMYHQGESVSTSATTARSYFKKACDMGHKKACDQP
jgi:TPR repeat protein